MESRLKKIWLNFLALSLGFLLVLVMLAAGEIFLRFYRPVQKKAQWTVKHNMSDFLVRTPEVGMALKPGFHGVHECTNHGEEIYRVVYEIDERSRRITPVDFPEERHGTALFFGCSFTFGQGVGQDETLPAAFGRECPGLLPINYAAPGYGPQHMWLRLREEGFIEGLPFDRGVVAYGVMDNHVYRLLGQKAVLEDWGEWLPWLTFDDGNIVLSGTMHDWILPESPFVKALKPFHIGRFVLNRAGLLKDMPYSEEEGVKSFVRYLGLVKEYLREILPGYEFVVFSYPWLRAVPGLGEELEKIDIPFFDYTNLYPDQHQNKGNYFYKDTLEAMWGHPKAGVYADVGKRLAADLAAFCNTDVPEAEAMN